MRACARVGTWPKLAARGRALRAKCDEVSSARKAALLVAAASVLVGTGFLVAITVGVGGGRLTNTKSYLYNLAVRVFHDGRRTPSHAGNVVVAKPFPEDAWFTRGGSAEVRRCVQRNRRALAAASLRLEGRRQERLGRPPRAREAAAVARPRSSRSRRRPVA